MANFFTKLFGRSKQSFTPHFIPIEDDAHQQPQHVKPSIISPILGYKSTRYRGGPFEMPEYDLAEVLAAEDIESYLKRANIKKETYFFKEGWDIVGRNKQTVIYIRKRLQQIAKATGIPTHKLFRQTVADLIKASNSFWVLVRDIEKSGGKRVNAMDPIAGIFIIPSETVRVKTTNNGRLLAIKQAMPDGREKVYNLKDIIHFTIDRKNGFAIGTPRCLPVLDDIRSLRRIEENVEMLLYKDLFPLIQYKVGTESSPAKVDPDGVTEIDTVTARVESMPPEGVFVTPERHEIKSIGSEGRALRAEGYLDHFKQRVFTGLGMSGVDFGETKGASKSSSEVVSQGLIDEVKDLQDLFEQDLQFFFLNVLLGESTFKRIDFLDKENEVKVIFREIDTSTQIAKENHNAQLFSQHAITHGELRQRIGEDEFADADWDDSYWTLIEEPRSLINAADEPYSAAAQALSQMKTSSIQPAQLNKASQEQAKMERTRSATKASSGTRAGANKDRPANQHGKKLQGIKNSSQVSNFSIIDTAPKALFTALRSDALKYSTNERNKEWFSTVLTSAQEAFKKRLSADLRNHFITGMQEISPIVDPNDMLRFPVVDNIALKYANRIFDDLQTNSLATFNQDTIGATFDNLEWRFDFLLRTEKSRARNYGRLVQLQRQGHTDIGFTTANDDQVAGECVKMSQETYDSRKLTLSTIPPHHPNCRCHIERR